MLQPCIQKVSSLNRKSGRSGRRRSGTKWQEIRIDVQIHLFAGPDDFVKVHQVIAEP